MGHQLLQIHDGTWVDPDEVSAVTWSIRYGVQIRMKKVAAPISLGPITRKNAKWPEIEAAMTELVARIDAARAGGHL